ncbi:DUF6115 domain-containing protein [Bacillus sp. FJAT-45037]|uniref:DUF6115 domain-containing protein n=1 Tax=Bacillus sp. FJAT-45037 TaxID=2011007 RepID=UPI000C24EB09|nr:hypothetical protein [Bacillus sp. FJAT-45037]
MTVYLLVISLLLHGVTILWMFTLAKKESVTNTSDVSGDRIKQEIEEMLFAYTLEMKEENERLLQEIKKTKQIKRSENDTLKPPDAKGINLDESTRPTMVEQPKGVNRVPKAYVKEESVNEHSEYMPPMMKEEDPATIFEQSDTANVLMLFKRGLSIEQIAKQLNLGKGEVELIIKFYR